MLRLWDWECSGCRTRQEHLIEVPKGQWVPKVAQFDCPVCGEVTHQGRLMSAPAPYMGEKTLNPIVRGGRFDTAGNQELPELPQCPGEAEAQAKASRAIASLPPTATREEIRAAAFEASDSCRPKLDDYAAHFESPAYKDADKRRAEVAKRNAKKRKRLRALKRGENVNMRRDRCAGDPNLKS